MGNVKPVPEGMNTVTPVVAVEGASEFIDFCKRAFGAVEVARAPDPSGKKVWHAQFRIGDSNVFTNDVDPSMGSVARPASLWLCVEDVEASFKRAADAGAKVLMPPTDMFWGDRFGRVGDRWGNEWSLSQRVADLTPEQMQQAQDAFVAQMAQQRK